MGKHLKKFNTHSEYIDYIDGQDALLPNVSYCTDNNEMHFNPIDYSKRYLRTVALEDGTISFNIWKTMGTDYITSISYSLDDGETWVTTENEDDKENNLSITVNVNEGDSILWKGDARQTGYYDDEDDWVGSFFSSTARFNIDGNVMSLCYGDNFIGKDELENDGQFAYLFYDYYEELTCEVVNANNLALPATTLADGCYQYMFENCTSLVTAPELPATTLANYCYSGMFENCTSLVTAPELPATTLAEQCYGSMFYGCTSLVTAPELPATTLAQSCYGGMFNGCTSLNYIKAMFITTPSSSYTSNWVYGVAASGTFVKNSTATWNVTGNNGIPSNWVIKTSNI